MFLMSSITIISILAMTTYIPLSRLILEINKYSSLFLITVLSKLKYKYAYGRQVRLIRLPSEKSNFQHIKMEIPIGSLWKII